MSVCAEKFASQEQQLTAVDDLLSSTGDYKYSCIIVQSYARI